MKINRILAIAVSISIAMTLSGCRKDELGANPINSDQSSEIEVNISDFEYTDEESGVIITGYIGSDKSVVIPEKINGKTVTKIGNDAFRYRADIIGITLPDGLNALGSRAFGSCSGLTEIVIPDSVTEIGDSAFGGCTRLTSVTLGNGVEAIGTGCFSGCAALTSIALPDSLSRVGSRAFGSCANLTKVTYKGAVYISGDFDELITAAV